MVQSVQEPTDPGDAGSSDELNLQRQARVDAELALGRCQISLRNGRFEESVKACTQVLEKDSGHSGARIWRAQALWQLGKRDEALVDLEVAVEQGPDDPFLVKLLGTWQFEVRNMIWAARNLLRAVESFPGDHRLRLLAAMALMEIRESAHALQLVEPLFDHPDIELRDSALLVGGVLYLEQKRRPEARRVLSRVKSPAQGKQARQILAGMTRMERGFAAGFRMHTHWAMGLDTNPAYAEDLGVPVPKNLAYTLSQPLFLTWGVTPAWQIRGGLHYFYYMAPWDGNLHDRVMAFSSMSGELQVAHRMFLPTLGVPAHFETDVRYTVMALMGGDAMPGEQEPFVFTERVSGTAQFAMQSEPGREWEVGLTGWYSAFRDSDRDGPGAQLFLRHSRFYRQDSVKWFASIWAGGQLAQWEAWNQFNLGAWTGLSLKLPNRFELAGTLSLEGRHYPDSARAMADGFNYWNLPADQNRLDRMGSAGLVLSRPLGRDGIWRWEAVVRSQIMDSRVDYYSFSRWTFLFQLAGDISRR